MMDRRRFLQLLPLAPLGCIKEPPALITFEEELRQLLWYSPHLHRITPGARSLAIYLDGRELEYVLEAVASPRPVESVRGAVRIAVTDSDGNFVVAGDSVASEWLIGSVRWHPIEEHP